jgi:hypothetical protein
MPQYKIIQLSDDYDCQEYINEYNDLSLIKGNYDINNRDDFEGSINQSYFFIEKICPGQHCEGILLADTNFGEFYNSPEYELLHNTEKLLIKETMIELMKRQLGILMNELCGPCVIPDNVQLTRDKCARYIHAYNNLRFMIEGNNYNFSNKDQFMLDMNRAIEVIIGIQDENRSFNFSELIRIDKVLLKYFERDPFMDNMYQIREIAANLLTDQVYVMIKIICNICKLKRIIDFDLDDEIRQPHDPNITPGQCVQAIKSQLNTHIQLIVEKLKTKKSLDANDKKVFSCVLLGRLDDHHIERYSLIRIYIDWVVNRISSGRGLSEREKVYARRVLTANAVFKSASRYVVPWKLYEQKSFEAFLNLHPGLKIKYPGIRNWSPFDSHELGMYYNLFFRSQGIGNLFVETDLSVLKSRESKQGGGSIDTFIHLYKLFYKLSKKIHLLNKKYDFIYKIVHKKNKN